MYQQLRHASYRTLRYGMNPHQMGYFVENPELFQVRNGTLSYCNLLDAITSWQFIRDLRNLSNKPVMSSWKHTTPVGVFQDASPNPSSINDMYQTVRDIDPLSSYGDFIACSEVVTPEFAESLRKVVSDGIIAPGYEGDAPEILATKKNGNYLVLEGNISYQTPELETRSYYGITMTQKKNNYYVIPELITNQSTEIPEDIQQNMILAYMTLKYTPSNSIAIAHQNQVIGVGSGQQNRVDCLRIAGKKALRVLHRRHPIIQEYKSLLTSKGQQSIIDMYDYLENDWKTHSQYSEVNEDIITNSSLVMASDGCIPFGDVIEEAIKYGIRYIIQPGGSIRDEQILQLCESYGITMVMTGHRVFTH